MSETPRVDRRKYLRHAFAVVAVITAVAAGYYSYFELHRPELIETHTQTQIIESITPKEAYTLIQNNKGNPDFVILDVRTPAEFADEHIENAVNLDFYSENFRDDLNKLDKSNTYIVYCRTGSRSGKSLEIMKELGFREVYNISGGIVGWKAEGLPTTK